MSRTGEIFYFHLLQNEYGVKRSRHEQNPVFNPRISSRISRIFPIWNTFHFFFSSASIKTWNTNFLFRIFIQRNEGNGFSRAVSTCSCAHFSSCENDKRRPCLMTAEAPLPYHKGPSPQRFHFHGFRLQHAKVLFFFATIVPSVNIGNTC